MVCNDVKYYPEKDADSYYARPRSESFNPMTSLSFSLSLSLSLRIPTPVGKCWPVISIANLLRAVFKGRGAAERSSEKKEYLLLAISFFVSICVLLPRDKPTPRSFFFFFQFLPLWTWFIDVALARDHKLYNRDAIWIYKFAAGMTLFTQIERRTDERRFSFFLFFSFLCVYFKTSRIK